MTDRTIRVLTTIPLEEPDLQRIRTAAPAIDLVQSTGPAEDFLPLAADAEVWLGHQAQYAKATSPGRLRWCRAMTSGRRGRLRWVRRHGKHAARSL